MPQPLLSIGMIVKDEERCLEKCLSALMPLRQAIPCELVIADTGSTDKTKEIASKYADILFDFKWVNDFSAARNAVMDKCSGKWYLTVDADEYLLPDITELVDFLKGPLADTKNLATIIQRNHKSSDMSGAYADFNATRMVRMATNKRYVGTIHEHFPFEDPNDCYVLTNTIVDHDGYTPLTETHLEDKELRNLELLEVELKKDPNNLQTILQCLESSAKLPEKRKFYVDYTMKKLNELDSTTPMWNSFADSCAYRVANYKSYYNSPDLEDWVKWVLEKFPRSDKVNIDVKYIYVKYLYANKRFNELPSVCKDYLTALNNYKNSNNSKSVYSLASVVNYVHPLDESTIRIIYACTLAELGMHSDGAKEIELVDLKNLNNELINIWFIAVLKIKDEKIKGIVSKKISEFFADEDCLKYHESVLNVIRKLFSCEAEGNKQYEIFEDLSDELGLSCKIISLKSKAEAEGYLSRIQNWKKLMPLALKKALLLKVDFPNEFFVMNSTELSLLFADLCKDGRSIVGTVTEHYCNPQAEVDFPYVSFVFNLLISLLFNSFDLLNDEERSSLINNFTNVAEIFLTECYNSNLLENDNSIRCLPSEHLFAVYAVRIFKVKDENSMEYVRLLRETIKAVPQATKIVEFLLNEYKKENEAGEKERMQDVSPELLGLAKQLKIMLSVLPPDSPELLAIKQSPMYKQVAFLIE